ncbi:MAG: T9SS type A sorting domain-containing protein [Bacteroidia bacterium]|nr:T9SS type A sorting domain-containing protein [Bacteroidia bacterium]
MKKLLLLFTLLLVLGTGLQAQTYPVMTIDTIQSPIDLSNCRDSSKYTGDTVIVYGVAIMEGGIAQAAGGRNVWIQDGAGPWAGLDVYGSSGNVIAPTDILDFNAGDSVAITGVIGEYFGETEFIPLSAIKLATNRPVYSNVVSVCDLNDAQQNNNIQAGEQWEGTLVEIQNVTVVSVDFFSGGNRVSFYVQDQNGCRVNISDRFLVQRLPANGGTFVPPTVGDQFCSIKGVLTHSKNFCGGGTGRGYEIWPFDTSHYQICSAAPSIYSTTRNISCPSSTDTVKITCDILDSDGISSAKLFYATGVNCTAPYTSVNLINTGGNSYLGAIPPQPDGTFVKYYIEATDTGNNTSQIPSISNGSDPRFYRVNNDGCTIYDIQFVPSCFSSDKSGYDGLSVTIDGVVTASAEPNNLGTVFIQQENQIEWAGIMATGSATLANLKIGDKVELQGDVKEAFFITGLENVSSVSVLGTGTITPVTMEPQNFTTYNFATTEQFEHMLITLAAANSDPLYVVEKSADGSSNFAEYRVGLDQFDPSNGCRVQAGRQTSSSIASNNVSYINDSIWIIDGGALLVDPCVVNEGTEFQTITGIMYYSFSNWKLLPRNNNDYSGGYADQCPLGFSRNPGFELGHFLVYPNPAQNQLNLDYDLANPVSGIVEIRDLMGRVMLTDQLNGSRGTLHLNTSGLNAGTYVLNFREASGSRSWNAKFVLVK